MLASPSCFFVRRACVYGAVLLPCLGLSTLQAQPAPIELGDIVLDHEVVVSSTSLQFPVFAANAGDGSNRLFVVDRPGAIHILQDDNLVSEPFLDITSEVVSTGERGLLGLAFHPEFAAPGSNGYRKLYTFHSTEQLQATDFPLANPTHQNVITEWQIDPDNMNRVDLSTRREVLRVDHRGIIHPGSTLAFDSNDYLYITFGDPNESQGQDTETALGSIFRIDPLHPDLTDAGPDLESANGNYRIPATNPFLADPMAIDEMYAHGFRNPWRGSVDRETDTFFIGDVGQGSREEINVIVAGGNYGWSFYEGTRPHRNTPSDPSGLTFPLAEYSHNDGRSVIGGYVYRGSEIPWLEGLYVFGDLSDSLEGPYRGPGPVFYLDPYDENGELRDPSEIQIQEFPFLGGRTTGPIITAFAEDEQGELYIVGLAGTRGQILRLLPGPAPLAGDFNGNGLVEQQDLDLVLSNWGMDGATVPEGWINDLPDGIIDQQELDAVLVGWGNTFPGTAASAIPEPGSGTLLIVASLLLAARACHSRHSAVAGGGLPR